MKEIRLWTLESDTDNKMKAVSVDGVRDTETEQMLEELLIASPHLLMNRLRLIGRQVPTKGGPLDLLGLDETGRLVIFELKKGALTRDAVTQAIDYASHINDIDIDELSNHLQDRSGHGGIEEIEDFQDWYDENYPGSSDSLNEKPRIVLVGLGADGRAVRMVNFLADSAIDIQLLTFHAFRKDGQLFLAKQIETLDPALREPKDKKTRYTKENNRAFLRENAEELKVTELLDNVKRFLSDRLPAYEWPGKRSYTFSLLERSSSGKPTYRVYVSLYLQQGRSGRLNLNFTQNAYQAAKDTLDRFMADNPELAKYNEKYQLVEVPVSKNNWETVSEIIDPLMPVIVEKWKSKQSEESVDTED